MTNAEILKGFYERFAKGDVQGMLEFCSDDVTFQIAGKSRLAGKYTRATLAGDLLEKISSLSGGTHGMELHDVMASDVHGLVLTTNTLTRDGKKHEYRAVHVWRIQQGKLVAWYLYPRDLYAFDAIWA
ncbi:MAG: nuclear transport factor 2 family protein [Deltaproteobacteria bacterium]|nr:nuclear transport factor 2 family protein [Deltaproteobacteria bacterium]